MSHTPQASLFFFLGIICPQATNLLSHVNACIQSPIHSASYNNIIVKTPNFHTWTCEAVYKYKLAGARSSLWEVDKPYACLLFSGRSTPLSLKCSPTSLIYQHLNHMLLIIFSLLQSPFSHLLQACL